MESSGSVEKRMEGPPPFSLHRHHQGGASGMGLQGPTVEAGPAYTKPRPSALGNCVSTGARQTLFNQNGQLLQRSAAALPGLILAQLWIYRYSLPSPHFSSLSLPSSRPITLVIGLPKQMYLIHSLDTCSSPLYIPFSLSRIIKAYSFSLWVTLSLFPFSHLFPYFPSSPSD